jgi:hypothetical protein
MAGWDAAGAMTDEDFSRTILRAIRLLAVVAAVGAAILWWKLGWASAALLVVGAAISGTGLWEWMRLMTAVMARMDAGAEARPMGQTSSSEGDEVGAQEPVRVRPMGRILLGFFLRLGLSVVVLYVSLKTLNGSVYALAAGLGLGVFSLTVEGLRMVKAWTA